MDFQIIALEHLLLRLKPINRALRLAAEGAAEVSSRLTRPDRDGVCLTASHVEQLLVNVDNLGHRPFCPGEIARMTPTEDRLEDRLRAQAAACGSSLPITVMQEQLALSAFEVEAALICLAPQLDRAYERIYAFIADDVQRLSPSLELLTTLTAGCWMETLSRRRMLGPSGHLRRLGIVKLQADRANPLHATFCANEKLLTGLIEPDFDWPARFVDRDDVDARGALPLEKFPDGQRLHRIAASLNDQTAVGLWGPRRCGTADAAMALASAAGRALRRLRMDEPDHEETAQAIDLAGELNAMLWLDTDAFRGSDGELPHWLGLELARTRCPLIITGRRPWHPLSLLTHRQLFDITLKSPDIDARTGLWQTVVGDLDADGARQLAERYQFSPSEMRAASLVADVEARLNSNGHESPRVDFLPRACRTVTLRHGARYAQPKVPVRGPEDLILPAELHRKVLQVADFYRCWSRVDEGWGFGRIQSGGGGIKVLFTGDSGTGKTAAAEVIAGRVEKGQTLLKVDLATVVSKWVGETEKHLDEVFQHAEDSHAVLFFDEADALFSKRGEVERGSDRYSNLEVGFLLQRLEEFSGLAVLASNHKDQIDQAFMRRFDLILHFPRPDVDQRARLWRLALPRQAPLSPEVDIELLKQLDLTGASIVSAARNAALEAAHDGSGQIQMSHLVQAVARQFQQEARLLPLEQLGRYADYTHPVQ
ncbi:MAG: ATP-binding protein [Xanthomonadales bacterium]|nr:ATP-binding protein [Xanthomonadales bacterium]